MRRLSAVVLLLCGLVTAQVHESVKAQFRDGTIAAELYAPEGKGRFPLVVVLPGSGITDKGMRDKIRGKIWGPLLGAGMAVLFYDNPGVMDSTGTQLANEAAMADVTLTALAAVRDRPDLDSSRLALLGLSNGGWVAPVVATREPKVNCVVLISGAAVSPAQQDINRLANMDRMRGATEQQVKKLTAARQVLYRYFATGTNRDEALAVYARMQSEPDLAPLKQQTSPKLSDVLPKIDELAEPAYRWYKPLYTFDPVKYLSKLQQPTLALYGENDPLVNVHESEEILRGLKQQRPAWDLTIKVYPDAGHGLEKREANGPMHNPAAPPADGFPDDMITWLRAHLN